MEATEVIKKPLITEKTTFDANEFNRYAFEVDLRAGKPEIKAAIETLYKVKVASVRTQVRKGKYFRNRFGTGKTSPWKRAAVTLEGEDRIDLF